MRIDVEKFALAVVNSSSPELSVSDKIKLYQEASDEADKFNVRANEKVKKNWGIK